MNLINVMMYVQKDVHQRNEVTRKFTNMKCNMDNSINMKAQWRSPITRVMGVEIQTVEVISIYAIFKMKNINEINLADHIFLRVKRVNFLRIYRPIFCIFQFDMSSSYHDAAHKFRIHISTNFHRTNEYQI